MANETHNVYNKMLVIHSVIDKLYPMMGPGVEQTAIYKTLCSNKEKKGEFQNIFKL